jgi:mono/diheme cytochrome c family protein
MKRNPAEAAVLRGSNTKRLSITILVAAAALSAAPPPAMDSTRGQQVFQSSGCVQCHSLNGRGGKAAPDLGKIIDRGFSPAMLAATMWNHAPVMWSTMRARNVQLPPLSPQEAADLFAAFYASHYFDTPADAARGKAVFTRAACAQCHGLVNPKLAAAPPVNNWSALSESVSLVANMWNHATNMQAELEKQKIAWPSLSGNDVADLLIYLRNLPGSRRAPSSFTITAGDEGRKLFDDKGCAGCHAIDKLKTKGMTLDDVAASLWNHANRLKATRPRLDQSEMSAILGYVWASQFFQDSGNATRGSRVFVSRDCVECHGVVGSGAPDLAADAGSISGITIVSALWRHGPTMLDQMAGKGIRWPQFRSGEMADLIAYVNAGKK